MNYILAWCEILLSVFAESPARGLCAQLPESNITEVKNLKMSQLSSIWLIPKQRCIRLRIREITPTPSFQSMKKICLIGITNWNKFIPDFYSKPLYVNDFVNGNQKRFMHSDKIAFWQHSLKGLEGLQTHDLLIVSCVNAQIVTHSFNVENAINFNFLNLILCFYKDTILDWVYFTLNQLPLF